MEQLDRDRFNELADRIVMLEKMVRILLYISKEKDDFWIYTNRDEQTTLKGKINYGA